MGRGQAGREEGAQHLNGSRGGGAQRQRWRPQAATSSILLHPAGSQAGAALACGHRIARGFLGRPQPQGHNGRRHQHKRLHALWVADHAFSCCCRAHAVPDEHPPRLLRRLPILLRRGAAGCKGRGTVVAALRAGKAAGAAGGGIGHRLRPPRGLAVAGLVVCWLRRRLLRQLSIQDGARGITIEVQCVEAAAAGPAGANWGWGDTLLQAGPPAASAERQHHANATGTQPGSRPLHLSLSPKPAAVMQNSVCQA